MRKTLAGPMGIRILVERKHASVNVPVYWELIQLSQTTELASPRRTPAASSLTGTCWYHSGPFITCFVYVTATYVKKCVFLIVYDHMEQKAIGFAMLILMLGFKLRTNG